MRKIVIVAVAILMLTFIVSLALTGAISAAPFNQTDGFHGMKFLDRDGDGVKDNDEPGIPGWLIFLEGEGLSRATETNEEGAYWFTGLMTGTYTISETQRPGWQQTSPAEGSYTFSYVPSQPIDNLNFGNRPELGEIHGVKFFR